MFIDPFNYPIENRNTLQFTDTSQELGHIKNHQKPHPFTTTGILRFPSSRLWRSITCFTERQCYTKPLQHNNCSQNWVFAWQSGYTSDAACTNRSTWTPKRLWQSCVWGATKSCHKWNKTLNTPVACPFWFVLKSAQTETANTRSVIGQKDSVSILMNGLKVGSDNRIGVNIHM